MKSPLWHALLALSLTATASYAVPIDATLAFAATGGYWESTGRGGAYRVLVFSGGFEHVSSRVVAEWVAEAGGASATAAVVSEHELVGFGFFSLGAPELARLKDGVRVTLSGVETHTPERKVTCVFDLHPKGQVTVVRQCG